MWVNPKTDWNLLTYFNKEDYNRIKGNIEHIADFSSELYRVSSVAPMGEDKSSYEDYYYADEINAITANLEAIARTVQFVETGNRITYYDNGAFIAWEDLNRIESAILDIYELLAAQKAALPRLAFSLGSQKGIKC